ncbi:Nitrilase [uncultured archaeon]|nr:Nitrilase [uncultured archaeon]
MTSNAGKVKIALIQMRMAEEPGKNLAHALKLIARAAKAGARIVCLPELFTAKYFAQEKDRAAADKFAEEIPGRTTEALSRAARENKVVLIGGSIYEKAGGKLYNTSAVFDENGNMLGTYRKVHIPHDENYWEKEYFEQGDQGFKVFNTPYGNIGVLICYDQWFPEAARIEALMGADIIFYPTAIGNVDGIGQSEGSWQKAWENVMRGHSIANGIFTCGVNRARKERKIEFWGASFVCDAFGTTLRRAGKAETVLVVEADLDLGRRVKEGWHFFSNRRPGEYSQIAGKKV